MKPRIYGLETEFGYQGQQLDPYSDRFISNGARLYVDVGEHPEYATPECRDLRQLVAYDKAGELIALDAYRGRMFKNNTDSMGHTYGCHENYLIDAVENIDSLAPYLIPFLVTRQIFTGAGGITRKGRYILSPRALHIEEEVGKNTVFGRPIVNLRDEPHADRSKYARLHLIVGDANMSEVQTYLKFGTTSLVLDLIETGKCPKPKLANALLSLRDIALANKGWKVKTRLSLNGNRKRMRATEVQRIYLDAAHAHSDGSKATQDILTRWQAALDALDKEPESLNTWADWAIKRSFTNAYRRKHRISKTHDSLYNINLQYHDIHRDKGLFYQLQERGAVDRLISDKEIRRAVDTPPRNTRAWFRGNFVGAHEKNIRYLGRQKVVINWAMLAVSIEESGSILTLPNPFDSYDEYVRRLCKKPSKDFPVWLKESIEALNASKKGNSL